MLYRVLLIINILMLESCAQFLSPVGPDYTPPTTSVPTKWSLPKPKNSVGLASVPTRNLATWWRQFGDPQLNKLIEIALNDSLDLKLAQARLLQARLSRDLALGGSLPSISTSSSIMQDKKSSEISSMSATTMYDLGFDAKWELDLFGGIQRGIEAATAEQEASAANFNHAQVSLVAEVARNYVELRAYQRRLSIAHDNLASQAETLQLTEWRYQAGLTNSSDVEQAKTNLAQTRASIPDIEIAQAAAENRLAVLLGKPPGALHPQLIKPIELPALPTSVGMGIPADVLRQRPDLIAAERKLAAETARIGQKLAKRFPSLNLNASFGWQAYSFGALGSANALARAISGTLAATLFDGEQLKNAVAVQNAVQEQALISYKNSILTVLEEVENALIAYAAGRERADARRDAAIAAQNAAQLSRNLYQAGLTDFQKVLDTERTRLLAEDNLAIAEASMRTNLIKLYKALGGGWDPDKDVALNHTD